MAVRLVVRHEKGGDPGEELSYEFDQAKVIIGRGKGADVRLPDLSVSEIHAILQVSGSRYTLTDQNSTNGTRVQGTALVPQRPRTLESGDEIEIGAFRLRVTLGPIARGLTTPERTASLARRLLQELSPDVSVKAPPLLRVVAGPDVGTVVNLAPAPARLVIGRSEEADLVLTDRDVSREHLELERDLDGVIARDLASKNGLIVNGKRLRERRLRHGDLLTLGATQIAFEDPAEAALKELEGKADEPITRTAPQLATRAEEPPQAPVELPPKPVRTEPVGSTGADLLIYGLAALVLLASLLGLAWLFGT